MIYKWKRDYTKYKKNSDIISDILESRNVIDEDNFLDPVEDYLYDAKLLENIDIALKIVADGIESNKRFGVLWDTDTDGVTSGAIMSRYLKDHGVIAKNYINSGKAHGIKGDLKAYNGIDILIIVDSLNADNPDIYSKLKGLTEIEDIIVLDHHTPKEDKDYSDIVLVSSQVNYPNKDLSGAGVVWKFCNYLDQYYMTNYADKYYDLCACGIVADMMDLSEVSSENRYLVSKGLENINNLAVKKIVGSFAFNAKSVSFSIAPLINACNRMEENQFLIDAFMCDDNKAVNSYIKHMKECKERQNEEVDNLIDDVIAQAEQQKDRKMIVVFIESDYGISGLIGNKLLDKYKRPCLILRDCGDNYSGSMRAIGVDNFLSFTNESGLAVCTGHELSSGITIDKFNYERYLNYVENNLNLEPVNDNNVIMVDARISASQITEEFVKQVMRVDKITGNGFKQLTFLVDDVYDYTIGNMSQGKHLVFNLRDDLMFIKWNFGGNFTAMEDHSMLNDNLICVGTLECGWLGRKFSNKFIIDDFYFEEGI